MYAESHWRYHPLKRYYTCSCSRLRHQPHQTVRKCSLTFPPKNGIVTFYANATNKYGGTEKTWGWCPPFSWYLGYLRYNVLMAWAIRTIYTSKCVQMDAHQLPKTSKFYSICNKCDMHKP